MKLSKELEKKYPKEFLEALEVSILCPYCGEPNQLDPPLLCCGEVHAEEGFSFEDSDSDGGEYAFLETDFEEAYEYWLQQKEDKGGEG